MADLDLNERELAAGTAIAMQTIREDKKEAAEAARAASGSSRSALISALFVAGVSIGMLILMILMSP